MRKSFLISGAVLCCALLCGKELFVSVKGSDENSGSAKSPYKTVAFAISKAAPGDTVKILPGLYREEITVTNSGKKGAPITIAGTRGKNGEWLSVIESPGVTVDKWVSAPEFGPDVWKCKLPKNPLLVMMDGKTIAKINNGSMNLKRLKNVPKDLKEFHLMSRLGPGCRRIPGLDFFVISKEATLSHKYFLNVKQPIWPALNYVLCGWSKGYLYIRFVNGDTPLKHSFIAAYGNGFTLQNASYVNFRNLFMRGSRAQFSLTGKTSHIAIEDCFMMHGGYRIKVEPTVSFLTVRNNVMTSGYIRGDLFKHRTEDDMRGGLIYTLFKYLIGPSRSDDTGIYSLGSDTLIENNIILQGLIGIDAFGPRVIVRNNVIRGMASVGLCTGARTTGEFYGNLIMHCGIPLRFQNLRHERAKREEFHYRNVFIQGPEGGGFTYVHSESQQTEADRMNFDGKEYKKNPPNPVDPGKIYMYHNTFWGGENVKAAFAVARLSKRFRSALPFFFLNNVVKYSPRFNTTTHEMLTGNLLYKTREVEEAAVDPQVSKFNRVISVEETKKLWGQQKSAGMPQVAVAPAFTKADCAVDITKPFVYKGKTYNALPGFKGKAPFAGAFQPGESDKHFRELFNKAQKMSDELNKL